MGNMKKIKIIMQADCNKELIHPQYRDLIHWALYLNPEKYDISFFCTGQIDERILKRNNIKIICLNNKKILDTIKQIFHIVFCKYDVIISSEIKMIDYFYLKFRKLMLCKKKVIMFISHLLPYVHTKYGHTIFRMADLNIALSELTRKTFQDYFNEDIPVLNNIYDLSLFKPLKKYNERKKIVCIGSLNQTRKEPYIFISLVIEFPDVDFYWIGDGYYLNFMKNKIKKDHIENLTMMGNISQYQLSIVLPTFDIFVFTSIFDCFPNSIVEALACGLPVVAFDIWEPEAVIDNRTGYVVKSVFEMKEKLKYLLENEEVLTEMSKNARKRAYDFKGSKLAPKLELLIDSLVNNLE